MSQLFFNPHRIKAERIARNLSQEEVATKLGKKRAWLAKRENGIVNVGVDELTKIASILKIDDLGIFFSKNVPEKQRS